MSGAAAGRCGGTTAAVTARSREGLHQPVEGGEAPVPDPQAVVFRVRGMDAQHAAPGVELEHRIVVPARNLEHPHRLGIEHLSADADRSGEIREYRIEQRDLIAPIGAGGEAALQAETYPLTALGQQPRLGVPEGAARAQELLVIGIAAQLVCGVEIAVDAETRPERGVGKELARTGRSAPGHQLRVGRCPAARRQPSKRPAAGNAHQARAAGSAGRGQAFKRLPPTFPDQRRV